MWNLSSQWLFYWECHRTGTAANWFYKVVLLNSSYVFCIVVTRQHASSSPPLSRIWDGTSESIHWLVGNVFTDCVGTLYKLWGYVIGNFRFALELLDHKASAQYRCHATDPSFREYLSRRSNMMNVWRKWILAIMFSQYSQSHLQQEYENESHLGSSVPANSTFEIIEGNRDCLQLHET